jgi:hypothetical protein
MPSPPLVVPNAVQIRLMYALGGQGAFNVLHAIKTGSQVIDQTLTNAIGAAIKSAWSARVGPLAGAGAALIRVGLRDLSSPNQPEYLDSGAQVGGSASDDMLPANNAACVTLRSAKSGKSFTGRCYIGGFSELQNSAAGATQATASSAAASFLQDVSAALTTNSMQLGVLSRPSYAYVDNRTWTFNDGTTEVDVIGRGKQRAGAITPVTLIQSRNNQWESQRRRGNGRGVLPTIFTPIVSLEAR